MTVVYRLWCLASFMLLPKNALIKWNSSYKQSLEFCIGRLRFDRMFKVSVAENILSSFFKRWNNGRPKSFCDFFPIQSIIVVQNEHFLCISNVTVALLIWALFSFCCIFDDDDDNWPAAANCCLFFTTNNNNYITIFNIIIITRFVFPIKIIKK